MLEGQWFDLELGVFLVTCLELVVGDLWAEVMDMMETDIPREPLQQLWQLIEGAAVHAGIEELPLRMAFPVSRVEVVLDIKKPDAYAAGNQQDWYLHQQERRPADFQNEPAHDGGDRDIGPDHAAALALPGALFPEPVRECKDEE